MTNTLDDPSVCKIQLVTSSPKDCNVGNCEKPAWIAVKLGRESQGVQVRLCYGHAAQISFDLDYYLANMKRSSDL